MDYSPNTIYILGDDNVYIYFSAEPGIEQEIRSHFTFRVPGAQYMRAFKMKMWDGLIRLATPARMQGSACLKLYSGLLHSLLVFIKSNSYVVEYKDTYKHNKTTFTDIFLDSYVANLKITSKNKVITPRDYQIKAFKEAINQKRILLLSPTSSGKSLIVYMLSRFYIDNVLDDHEKILIIVPTTSLVEQLKSDFEDYSTSDPTWNNENEVHVIYSGKEKQTKKRITISTWQSLYKLPKEAFSDKVVVFGDEAHTFQSKSLGELMEKTLSAPYKIGTTGTIQDAKTHQLVLQGLFGPILSVTTTKELMDSGDISELSIKCILLDYPDSLCKAISVAKYQDEYNFLIQDKKRNKFIADLALNTKDNTLLLFKNIEHGKTLYEAIIKNSGYRKIFFIYGKTDVEEREEIRRITDKEIGAIIVASYGTFSVGVNVKNIYDVIFASPTKSRIRNLQSIGRGLRIGDRGSLVRLYDIADNLKWKSKYNFTLKHYIYRIKLYTEQKFNYKQLRYPLYGKKESSK
jgi:superfamily II DNA or RNA helicase